MTQKPPVPKARLLVVDDEPDLRTLYELTLRREGHHVQTAGNVQQARQILREQVFDVLITDMRLPDGLGLELLQWLRERQRGERCVVVTAYGTPENAVDSLKAGAFDYLTKPVDPQQLRAVVASALQGRESAPAPRAVQPLDGQAALAMLVGGSPAMRQVRERIARVAAGMAPVLVCGEPGSGKELVARALHACSQRAGGPWVVVNCGVVPEPLLEAEFFGARQNVAAGVTQDRDGFFQAARGGTLFLDEVDGLPLAMQAKLLRVMQERRVLPPGGMQEELVDVRIVSATHKDLAAEVQAGRFRQDLYYRLNVIDIHVPPLRERREDLPDLCNALLKRIAAESGLDEPPAVSPGMLNQLGQLPLPGNVRELENLLHRALALSNGPELELDASGAGVPPPVAPVPDAAIPPDLQSHLDRQERDILIQTLRETGFNRTAAAARLGLSLRQIRYRMARLQIDVPQEEASRGER